MSISFLGLLALLAGFLAYAPSARADAPPVPATAEPAIAAPPDIVTEGNVATGASRVDLGAPTVSVAPRPTVSNDAPSVFPLGTTAVTWTATDVSGNQSVAVQNVTVLDTTPPRLVPPSSIIVEQTSRDGTEVPLGVVGVSDYVDANPVVTNDAPAVFPLGTTQVIWTATDATGNKRMAAQMVTVVDTSAPSIIVPGDITRVPRTSRERAIVLGTPMVTDICDASPSVTNDAPAIFPLGTTSVTWTVTDASGNKATAVQKVTIVDTKSPYLIPLRGIWAEATSPSGTPLHLTAPKAFDNFDPDPTVTNDAPAAFPLGTTTVTWTATDAAGNKGTTTQKVTIVDTKAPAIDQPQSIFVEQAYKDGTPVELAPPSVKDNTDASPMITSDARPSYPLGATTVTWTATDASGNKSAATQTVMVMDTTPPRIVAPPHITIEATSSAGGILYDLGAPTATDTCDAAPVITNDSRFLFLMGANVVTWMATDASGNTGYAFQTVYVVPATEGGGGGGSGGGGFGSPTPAPAYPTATPGGPPRIPHDLTGRTECLTCHANGLIGAPIVPPSHSGRTNAICRNCHIAVPQPATATPTPTTPPPPGTTPTPVGPPMIPHTLAGRSDCLVCHATGLAGAILVPASHAGRTSSMCLLCHSSASAAPTATPTLPPGTTPTATPTLAPGSTPTTTPPLGPPFIPHDLAGRSDCLMCHATGLIGAPILPASHAGRTSSMCLLCHSQAPAAAPATATPTTAPPSGTTPTATPTLAPGATATATPTTAPLGPPRIPHDLAGRSDCLACHATGLIGAPILPASHAGRTSSMCLLCHSQAPAAPTATATPAVSGPPVASPTPTVSGPTATPTLTPPTPTPTKAPPAILHALTGQSDCLGCHATGLNGAKIVPASHAGRTNAMCTLCHSVAPGAPTRTTGPRIPHSLTGRSDCLACHRTGVGDAERVPSDHAGRTSQICLLCHSRTSSSSSATATMLPGPPASSMVPGLASTTTPAVSASPPGAAPPAVAAAAPPPTGLRPPPARPRVKGPPREGAVPPPSASTPATSRGRRPEVRKDDD